MKIKSKDKQVQLNFSNPYANSMISDRDDRKKIKV